MVRGEVFRRTGESPKQPSRVAAPAGAGDDDANTRAPARGDRAVAVVQQALLLPDSDRSCEVGSRGLMAREYHASVASSEIHDDLRSRRVANALQGRGNCSRNIGRYGGIARLAGRGLRLGRAQARLRRPRGGVDPRRGDGSVRPQGRAAVAQVQGAGPGAPRCRPPRGDLADVARPAPAPRAGVTSRSPAARAGGRGGATAAPVGPAARRWRAG